MKGEESSPSEVTAVGAVREPPLLDDTPPAFTGGYGRQWSTAGRAWTLLAVLLAACLLAAATVPQAVRAEEPPPPPAAWVEGLVGYPQEHNLSCESRSATDLAAFWSVPFSEDDFFRRLPKSDNPNRGFLGDVDLPPGSMPPYGYGVYAGPIAANLRSFGLNAWAHHGWDLEPLKAELAAGRPVIIWATYDMQLPGTETWTSSDGETSVIARWQHTFIAVGYDQATITLVDAYDAGVKPFSLEAFYPAWDQLGRLAVTVRGGVARPRGRVWRIRDDQLTVDGRWAVGPE